MPPLTRWLIKTALVYFVLALAVGLLIAIQMVWENAIHIVGLSPVYVHLLVVGWLTMLIMGVAYWMFPKYSRDLPRGSEALGWASYILLNAGLILRIASEPAYAGGGALEPARGILLAIAAFAQWLGGMAFVANTWQRVKEK